MGRKNRRVRDDRLDDLVIPHTRNPTHRSTKFGDRRDKRGRDRSSRERNAIEDAKDNE